MPVIGGPVSAIFIAAVPAGAREQVADAAGQGFISGLNEIFMLGGVLSLAAALVALWLVRERRYPGPRLHGKDDIDREELEAAEREVRELERGALPDDERPGDDWGPGTGRPRPPTRL